tara:strand:+ start:1280 stop:2149 length:870 start_codon:yes stop_codon:yes gene_type:complete
MLIIRLTYYPDITQKQSDNDVRNAVVVFANALAADLSTSLGKQIVIEVPPVMQVPAQYNDIVAGNSAIALMKPVAYVLAHKENQAIVPACVAHRPIRGQVGTYYYAQIYARKDTGLKSIGDLVNAPAGLLRMAYGDRFSTSNFLIPASVLQTNGIHPFLFFRQVTFAGGHDAAAEAVYGGEADIGAGHDGAIKILAQTNPDAEDRLVPLVTENIHSDPVVVNTSVLPEGVTLEHIQESCERVAKTEPVLNALDLFWGWVKDLSKTEHTNYASIERALAGLHLSKEDMLS